MKLKATVYRVVKWQITWLEVLSGKAMMLLRRARARAMSRFVPWKLAVLNEAEEMVVSAAGSRKRGRYRQALLLRARSDCDASDQIRFGCV